MKRGSQLPHPPKRGKELQLQGTMLIQTIKYDGRMTCIYEEFLDNNTLSWLDGKGHN